MTRLVRRLAVVPTLRRPTRPDATTAIGRVGLIALFLAAIGYIARYGTSLPMGDEWYVLRPLLTDPFPLSWLIEHHNEHRYPLAKTIWAISLAVSGWDFRVGMVLSAVFLTAAAALFVTAARRARGYSSVADLVFPAALLHWGHGFNLTMSYQVAFTLVPLAAAAVVWAADRTSRWADIVAMLGVMVLTTCGGFGVGFAGPGALWLAYRAWHTRRWGLLVAAVSVVGYTAFVALTTPPPANGAKWTPLAELPSAVGLYLTDGLGYPGLYPRPVVIVAVVIGLAVAAGLTVRAAVQTPSERPVAFALLALLAGHFACTAAVAAYRGTAQGQRFVTPSAVGLCVAWVALVRYGPRLPGWAGAAAAVWLFAVNIPGGNHLGMFQRGYQKGVVADMQAGLPPLGVAGKYGSGWYVIDADGDHLRALRAAGVRPFDRMAADPPFVPVSVSLPTEVPKSDNASFTPGGPPPAGFGVPDPAGRVVGLRVRLTGREHVSWARLVLRWTEDGVAKSVIANPPLGERTSDVVFWVGGGLPTSVRLEVGCPTAGFDVTGAEWLMVRD